MPDHTQNPIPTSGPMTRPKSVTQAAKLLHEHAHPAPNTQRITFHTNELTSVCPMTGQPDFGTLTITYTPNERILESKSLKFYVWSLREQPAFCEALAASIADDITNAIQPANLRVTVTQNTRGGLALEATAER